MTVVVGYTRVSTKAQVREAERGGGDSVAEQAATIRRWCVFQQLPAPTIVSDDGISGASIDGREGFQKAVATALKAAPNACLVVVKLDRLGRNAVDVLETVEMLLHHKVRIVSINDGVDSAGAPAMLKMMLSMLATFAEMEKDTIVARLKGGIEAAKRDGRNYTGSPPYGLRNGPDGRVVVDKHERAAISRARALKATGKMTLEAIGAQLFAEGFRSRAEDGKWPTVTLWRICNPHKAKGTKKMSSRIKATTEKFSNTGLGDALKVEIMAGKVKPTELPANVERKHIGKELVGGALNYTPFPKEPVSDAEIADLVKQPSDSVEQASGKPTVVEQGDQKLVNRRLVKKPDFLRDGKPLDIGWAVEQVQALRDLKTPSHKIVSALDRVGVRRGDGSPITVADVERWGQEA